MRRVCDFQWLVVNGIVNRISDVSAPTEVTYSVGRLIQLYSFLSISFTSFVLEHVEFSALCGNPMGFNFQQSKVWTKKFDRSSLTRLRFVSFTG